MRNRVATAVAGIAIGLVGYILGRVQVDGEPTGAGQYVAAGQAAADSGPRGVSSDVALRAPTASAPHARQVADGGTSSQSDPRCIPAPEVLETFSREIDNEIASTGTPGFEGLSVDGRVGNLEGWLQGVASALALQPDVSLEPLRESLADRVCAATAGPPSPAAETDAAVALQLMRKERRLASIRALECALSSTTETSGLRTAVDLVDILDYPRSAQWQRWHDSPGSAALRARFSSIDETGHVDLSFLRRPNN